MSFNRMTQYFDEFEDETPERQPVPAKSAFVAVAPLPFFVRQVDLYQAAHAQAVHDHEIDKLFNPAEPIE